MGLGQWELNRDGVAPKAEKGLAEDRHGPLEDSEGELKSLYGDPGNFLPFRSRLMDFQTHCHPMDILGTCATEHSRCLRAYLGLIGEAGACVGSQQAGQL